MTLYSKTDSTHTSWGPTRKGSLNLLNLAIGYKSRVEVLCACSMKLWYVLIAPLDYFCLHCCNFARPIRSIGTHSSTLPCPAVRMTEPLVRDGVELYSNFLVLHCTHALYQHAILHSVPRSFACRSQ